MIAEHDQSAYKHTPRVDRDTHAASKVRFFELSNHRKCFRIVKRWDIRSPNLNLTTGGFNLGSYEAGNFIKSFTIELVRKMVRTQVQAAIIVTEEYRDRAESPMAAENLRKSGTYLLRSLYAARLECLRVEKVYDFRG